MWIKTIDIRKNSATFLNMKLNPDKAYKLNNLWKEFIALLETTEESDSGNEFRPNSITSCRAVDGERINQIIKEAKELTF